MRKIIIILLFVTQLINLHAQLPAGLDIDSLVQRTIVAFDVPGIAVAVVKDGKILHSKGYGYSSLKTLEPVNENTRFAIASNTKGFTTAALGILIDEGKLRWDDKVTKFIPEFRMYNDYVTGEFTVRDLLTHRSGLGLGAGDLMFYPDSSDFTIKDVIHNLRFLKPVSGFRSRYDYDNTLYIVAGEVVSRVSGRNWDSFVEERIFKPLSMNGTSASHDRLKDKHNVSDPHVNLDGKVQVVRRHISTYSRASGSVYSSAADLAKWVLLHLNHGKYGHEDKAMLFTDKVHEDMWTPQTIIPVRNPGPYNTHFSAYGLGFGLSDVKGLKQINHTGGTTGMFTQVTMIPELNLGIVVLTNQQAAGAFQTITDQIKDVYLGIGNTDRVSEYAPQRRPGEVQRDQFMDSAYSKANAFQKAGKKNSFNAFTGTYQDNWFGEVVISAKDGRYWFASKRSPRLTGELLPYASSGFIVKWMDRSMEADAFVNFKTLTNGKSSGFKMLAISPFTDFSYDFHDLDFKRSK